MKRERFSTDFTPEERAIVAEKLRREPDLDAPRRRVERLKQLAAEQRDKAARPAGH